MRLDPGLSCALVIAAGAAGYAATAGVAAARWIGHGGSDFLRYHQAAEQLASGASPYAASGFIYPPLAVAPVLPIAGLSYPDARIAWFVVSHLAVLASALLIWRRLGGDRVAGAVVAAVWGLGGVIAPNLGLGQVNVVLLLLVAVAVSAAKEGVAAACLATAAAVKLWPGLLLLAHGLCGRWRVAAGGAALAVLLVAVPLALLAPLPGPATPQGHGFWAGTPALLNLSLPAAALRLAEPPREDGTLPRSWIVGNALEGVRASTGITALALAVSVLVLAAGVGMVARLAPTGADRLPLVAALVAVALAAAPVSWFHYRLLHLPGLAWLGVALLSRRAGGRWIALWASVGLLLSWSHLIGVPGAEGLAREPWLVIGRGFLVPLIELALAAWYLLEARAEAHPPSS